MRREEFGIGMVFRCNGRLWRCTDIGARAVMAKCSTIIRPTSCGAIGRPMPWQGVFEEDQEACGPAAADGTRSLPYTTRTKSAEAPISISR
jgi:hypothetical protein